tara:strand:+ start:523 stop:726 length:204 start_codon:yes stop_codon:yes gene_type:complete
VLYPLGVLLPEGAIFGRATPVIVALSRKQKYNVIKRVEPWPNGPRVAYGKGYAAGHEDLTQVVDVSA